MFGRKQQQPLQMFTAPTPDLATAPPSPLTLEPPSAPQYSASSPTKAAARGRSPRGFSSTIMTSGAGLSVPATTGQKSLIGQ